MRRRAFRDEWRQDAGETEAGPRPPGDLQRERKRLLTDQGAVQGYEDVSEHGDRPRREAHIVQPGGLRMEVSALLTSLRLLIWQVPCRRYLRRRVSAIWPG